MNAPFDLARFIDAQESNYARALGELKVGQKRSHWMWYVFPQLVGLGHSEMAQRYALSGLGEARAYLAHPLLAARLQLCCETLLEHRDRSARVMFGTPDDLKLHSCMTLFAMAAEQGSAFDEVLEAFFDGRRDAHTVALLADGHAGRGD